MRTGAIFGLMFVVALLIAGHGQKKEERGWPFTEEPDVLISDGEGGLMARTTEWSGTYHPTTYYYNCVHETRSQVGVPDEPECRNGDELAYDQETLNLCCQHTEEREIGYRADGVVVWR